MMCPTIHYETGKLLMEDAIFDKIITFIEKNEVKVIDMTGWGEPLLDKSLPEKIKHIKRVSPKTQVVFSSNGTLFSDTMIEDILSSGVDRINISFDGATKETYGKVRLNSDFNVVTSMLRSLVKINNNRIWLSSTFVVMKDNYNEMEKYIELFHDIGFDEILFKPLNVISTRENKKHVLEKNIINDTYIFLKKKYEGKIVLNAWDLLENKVENNCLANAANNTFFINCNGDVSPCCNLGHHVPSLRNNLLINYQNKDNFFSFGSIINNELQNILDGKLFKSFENAFLNRRLPHVCKGCLLVSKYLKNNISKI